MTERVVTDFGGNTVFIEPFWTRRTPLAGETAFATPQDMYDAAVEAFNWYHNHPLREETLYHYQGGITRTHTNKMRPFTMRGIALAMGVSTNALDHYVKRSTEFAAVVAWIKDVVYTQKFEGAATNLLNAGFIARDLGLADRTELTGKDGGPIETSAQTVRERLAGRLAVLAARGGAPDAPGGDDGSGLEGAGTRLAVLGETEPDSAGD